jgi:hypothetical protein
LRFGAAKVIGSGDTEIFREKLAVEAARTRANFRGKFLLPISQTYQSAKSPLMLPPASTWSGVE